MSVHRVVLGVLLTLALGGCPGDAPPPPVADQRPPADSGDGTGGGEKDAGDAATDVADATGEAGVDLALCGGVSCNDNLACTDDVCTASGCTNTIRSGHCLINKTCYADGDKDASASCRTCDSATLNSGWTDDDKLCPGGSLAFFSA